MLISLIIYFFYLLYSYFLLFWSLAERTEPAARPARCPIVLRPRADVADSCRAEQTVLPAVAVADTDVPSRQLGPLLDLGRNRPACECRGQSPFMLGRGSFRRTRRT